MRLRWEAEKGANNVAALMVLMVICHHADGAGLATLNYDKLALATHLSRTKISAGLGVLEELGLIRRKGLPRSRYEVVDYATNRWGKLPAKGLYSDGEIAAFREFYLRRRVELDALKLYWLVVARRDSATNIANMKYETIARYSGIDRGRIRSAASLLAVLGLVHVERMPSEISDHGISNGYRLAHVDPYVHMGTRGRAMDAFDFAEVEFSDSDRKRTTRSASPKSVDG
jgi:DNA-binding transcriptional ArsR family regulator